MATITKFTPSKLKILRIELEGALATVLEKHGLSAKLGNMKYGDTHFHCKLEVNCGSSDDAERDEFTRQAFAYGLTGDDYGKSFTQGGESFRIVAFKPRSPKYPILAEKMDGKRYKFPESVLKNLN